MKMMKLCCGGKGCPSVRLTDNGYVEIEDDESNVVRLTTGQYNILIKKGGELA